MLLGRIDAADTYLPFSGGGWVVGTYPHSVIRSPLVNSSPDRPVSLRAIVLVREIGIWSRNQAQREKDWYAIGEA